MSERRREAFVALAPVYLSVFLFVAGNSALSILIPVYLSREAHLGAATIGENHVGDALQPRGLSAKLANQVQTPNLVRLRKARSQPWDSPCRPSADQVREFRIPAAHF